MQVNLKGEAAQLLEPGLATAAAAAGSAAAPAAAAAGTAAPAAVASAASGGWTEEQELALVKALKTVGKDAEDRWGQVGGRCSAAASPSENTRSSSMPTAPVALGCPKAHLSSAGGPWCPGCGSGAGEDQDAVLPTVQGAEGEPQGGKGQGLTRQGQVMS